MKTLTFKLGFLGLAVCSMSSLALAQGVPQIAYPPATDLYGNPIAAAPVVVKPPTEAELRLKEFREQPPVNMPIIITQPEWTTQVEQQYSDFVAQFGRGVKAHPMKTIKFYMADPNTNMYASTDPYGVIYYSDCADLPYFLRSYFAMKNGLPMSITVNPVMNPRPYASESTPSKDAFALTRTDRTDVAPYGNLLSRRAGSNMPAAPGREKQYLNYWGTLMDAGSTRSFRVGPLSPGYDFSDVYPVKVDREGIRPRNTCPHQRSSPDGHGRK